MARTRIMRPHRAPARATASYCSVSERLLFVPGYPRHVRGCGVIQPTGRPARFRMTGRQRREQLLNVARTLFAEKGFDSTSVERSEEHTSELQSRGHLVCRLLLEK